MKKCETIFCLVVGKEIIMAVLVSIMLESANLLANHALSNEDRVWLDVIPCCVVLVEILECSHLFGIEDVGTPIGENG